MGRDPTSLIEKERNRRGERKNKGATQKKNFRLSMSRVKASSSKNREAVGLRQRKGDMGELRYHKNPAKQKRSKESFGH